MQSPTFSRLLAYISVLMLTTSASAKPLPRDGVFSPQNKQLATTREVQFKRHSAQVYRHKGYGQSHNCDTDEFDNSGEFDEAEGYGSYSKTYGRGGPQIARQGEFESAQLLDPESISQPQQRSSTFGGAGFLAAGGKTLNSGGSGAVSAGSEGSSQAAASFLSSTSGAASAGLENPPQANAGFLSSTSGSGAASAGLEGPSQASAGFFTSGVPASNAVLAASKGPSQASAVFSSSTVGMPGSGAVLAGLMGASQANAGLLSSTSGVPGTAAASAGLEGPSQAKASFLSSTFGSGAASAGLESPSQASAGVLSSTSGVSGSESGPVLAGSMGASQASAAFLSSTSGGAGSNNVQLASPPAVGVSGQIVDQIGDGVVDSSTIKDSGSLASSSGAVVQPQGSISLLAEGSPSVTSSTSAPFSGSGSLAGVFTGLQPQISSSVSGSGFAPVVGPATSISGNGNVFPGDLTGSAAISENEASSLLVGVEGKSPDVLTSVSDFSGTTGGASLDAGSISGTGGLVTVTGDNSVEPVGPNVGSAAGFIAVQGSTSGGDTGNIGSVEGGGQQGSISVPLLNGGLVSSGTFGTTPSLIATSGGQQQGSASASLSGAPTIDVGVTPILNSAGVDLSESTPNLSATNSVFASTSEGGFGFGNGASTPGATVSLTTNGQQGQAVSVSTSDSVTASGLLNDAPTIGSAFTSVANGQQGSVSASTPAFALLSTPGLVVNAQLQQNSISALTSAGGSSDLNGGSSIATTLGPSASVQEQPGSVFASTSAEVNTVGATSNTVGSTLNAIANGQAYVAASASESASSNATASTPVPNVSVQQQPGSGSASVSADLNNVGAISNTVGSTLNAITNGQPSIAASASHSASSDLNSGPTIASTPGPSVGVQQGSASVSAGLTSFGASSILSTIANGQGSSSVSTSESGSSNLNGGSTIATTFGPGVSVQQQPGSSSASTSVDLNNVGTISNTVGSTLNAITKGQGLISAAASDSGSSNLNGGSTLASTLESNVSVQQKQGSVSTSGTGVGITNGEITLGVINQQQPAVSTAVTGSGSNSNIGVSLDSALGAITSGSQVGQAPTQATGNARGGLSLGNGQTAALHIGL